MGAGSTGGSDGHEGDVFGRDVAPRACAARWEEAVGGDCRACSRHGARESGVVGTYSLSFMVGGEATCACESAALAFPGFSFMSFDKLLVSMTCLSDQAITTTFLYF